MSELAHAKGAGPEASFWSTRGTQAFLFLLSVSIKLTRYFTYVIRGDVETSRAGGWVSFCAFRLTIRCRAQQYSRSIARSWHPPHRLKRPIKQRTWQDFLVAQLGPCLRFKWLKRFSRTTAPCALAQHLREVWREPILLIMKRLAKIHETLNWSDGSV